MTSTFVLDELGRDVPGGRADRAMARWCVAMACLLATGQAGASQVTEPAKDDPRSARAVPKLPEAVERVPDGIGTAAPFDVTVFFAAPPADLNAAPLYLDAFFEFDPDMAACFPEGVETARRKQIAERRQQSINQANDAFVKDPASFSGEAIDRLAADLETGFRKLEEAQRRPRCLFETGLDQDSPMPHGSSARLVTRLVALRARRSLDRGDIEQPLHDLAILLRLARDLRPRGPIICQLIADSITSIGIVRVIRPLLANPLFGDGHTRRLLDLLVQHEAASLDGYEVGIKGEYVIFQIFVANLVKDPRRTTRSRLVEDLVKKTTPAEIARVNARADEFFRRLLSMTDSPLSRDRVKLSDPRQVDDGSPYFDIVRTRMPSGAEAAEAEARVLVQIRATECLLALKLWMDRTHQVPTDLDTVVRAAGLPKVPIDPYSGRPLLMAIIDGEPVVYSIGLDGHDDGGRIDSRIVSQPGDQTFRLPSMEKPKR